MSLITISEKTGSLGATVGLGFLAKYKGLFINIIRDEA